MKIADINKVSVITLNHEFGTIIVNKVNHRILQTEEWHNPVYIDRTSECEEMEKEYIIGDMVIQTSYKGGVVVSKLLNNRTDRRCMKFMKSFDICLQ